MARPKLINLSRIWFTLIIVILQTFLIYFGLLQTFDSNRFDSTTLRIELLTQKICLFASILFLLAFIYPSLFAIGNFANDEEKLKINHLKIHHSSPLKHLWQHLSSLSCTFHLIMSFLVLIAPVLLQSKETTLFHRDSMLLRRTDLDLLFDWSPTAIPSINAKRLTLMNNTSSPFVYSTENYSRWCLMNFLCASFFYILREPSIFWSLSKIFSFLYSLTIALNVIQWSLMFGSLQLLLKNISFNSIDSRFTVGYLLSNQPYTTFFLYLLLEFLIFISSLTFYYYAYIRFQSMSKSSCYDRCSNYCPSLIAIIILLLYTACKMPLVHDIFLLYIQTRIRLLFFTFIFEIFHVLIILILWIFLTTKSNWQLTSNESMNIRIESNPPTSATSLPNLNRDDETKRDYEKIRIFQSEIYYQNRPKNWSLPLNQQPSVIAAFDTNDDIVLRSPSSPTYLNETISNALRKTLPTVQQDHRTKAVFLRSNTPPIPPVKRFNKEQVDAARQRAEQIFHEQQQQKQRMPEFLPHRHSAALLISQV